MKITGLQSRLEDNRSHEELLTAKFNLLNKSIEDIRMGNEITKGGRRFSLLPSPLTLSEKATMAEKINEVNKLKSETKSLNTQVRSFPPTALTLALPGQLNIANKRASDSERRLEETISRELKLKSDLTSTEMNLQLKLDKKKVQVRELLEQKHDLERVAQELYSELQNALLVTTRLEQDNEGLRDLIDEYRAGDACVPVLHEKLEIESEKNSKLKDQIAALRGDIALLKKAYGDSEERCRQVSFQLVELQEDHAGVEYELSRQTKRSDLLTQDNLTLENVSRVLKGQIVKLNDTIVDIKGSICVYCRVRPLFPDELRALNLSEEDIVSLIRYPDYNLLDYNAIPYEFDRVFEPSVGQDEVYEEVEAFIRSAMSGSRLCIFM
jgi:kinesin family member C1